jgi:hypothetical protein
MAAILLGFAVQIIMMMLIAICAFDRKSPTQLLYIGLLITGCVWLEIIIVLAVHYSTRVWQWVLILITLSAYFATAWTLVFTTGTLIFYNAWFISFYWLCAGITIVFGVIEIVRRDIRNGTQRTM